MDKQAILNELQKINSATSALYAIVNGIDPKAIEYHPPLMDGADELAQTVRVNYRPKRSMSANEVYHLWIAAGRPERTADGEPVDTRGAPMSWGSKGNDNWHKYDQPQDPIPAPPRGDGEDVPIDQA